MPQHQQAALLMAIYFANMSAQETAILTEEMMLSARSSTCPHFQAEDRQVFHRRGRRQDRPRPRPARHGQRRRRPDDVRRRAGVCHHDPRQALGRPCFKSHMTIQHFVEQLARVAAPSPTRARARAGRQDFYDLRLETGTIRASRSSPAACFPRSSPRAPRASSST